MRSETMRHRWGVSALFATNGFLMGAWAPQIPLLLTRHNITEGTLGLLILCLGLGAVGAMLFAGRLIGVHGSRRIAVTFAWGAVPALALVVFAPNLWVLTPLMAVMGAVIGTMDVAMNANAVLVERRLGRAIMSASHGFWSLGGFVGGAAGSFIIAHWGAEVQAIIATVIAAVLVAWAMQNMLRDTPEPREKDAPKHALIAKDWGLWILGLMALFSMVPEGAVLDWAAIYLSKELNAPVMQSGLGFALFAGAMAVMRFAGDGLRMRLGGGQNPAPIRVDGRSWVDDRWGRAQRSACNFWLCDCRPWGCQLDPNLVFRRGQSARTAPRGWHFNSDDGGICWDLDCPVRDWFCRRTYRLSRHLYHACAGLGGGGQHGRARCGSR